MPDDAPTIDPTELAGHVLIAMPGIGDPRFDRSVVMLCAHGPEGAMGLIINKPASEIRFGALLEQLEIEPGPDAPGSAAADPAIHIGGPVENGRGFVLHTRDYDGGEGTVEIGAAYGMTATLDILRAIVGGEGPERSLVALGYAGWGPGQLESEIARNGWLVADCGPDVVFDVPAERKWLAAIGVLGIDPILLSAAGGRA